MQSIIIFSSVRWNFLFQRHQSKAMHLASNHSVYFVEPPLRSFYQLASFIKNPQKIRVKSEIHNPFSSNNVVIVRRSMFNLFGTFDGRTIQKVKKSSDIRAVIVYIPSKQTRRLIQKNQELNFIYDRVLDWSKVEKAWYPPRNIETNEKFIFKSSNCEIISDSDNFVKSVNFNSRAKVKFVPTLPLSGFHELQGNPKGPLGYYGNLRESEIDIELVEELAQRFEVHVVGIFTREIKERLLKRGVLFTESISVEKLPKLISTWSKIILPYRNLPRTSTFVPDKLWSAGATKLQVVASGIEIPKYFHGRISLAVSREDFVRQCASKFQVQRPVYLDSDKFEELIFRSTEKD